MSWPKPPKFHFGNTMCFNPTSPRKRISQYHRGNMDVDIFEMVYENKSMIVECDVERYKDGSLQFFDILITDKETGQSYESLEMPDDLMEVSKQVANTELKK